MEMCTNYQEIKVVLKLKSSDQDIFLSINNFNPDCRWFYRTIGSDHPLMKVARIQSQGNVCWSFETCRRSLCHGYLNTYSF